MDKQEEKKTTVKTVNPTTNKTEKEFDPTPEDQINRIFEKADEAFHEWKKTSLNERANLLKRISGYMVERSDELARLAAVEMGKRIVEAKGEIQVCIGILEYYAEKAEEMLKDKPIDTQHGKAFISYEPMGVIFSVQPWNFPYYQIIRSCAPHIMAGNTYVVKHASNVPQCALAIEQMFKDAGAPEGVYTNIFTSGSHASELVGNKYIKGVTFTGSEKAGASIASQAGKYVRKSVLELGGSDPVVILDEENIDNIVKMVAMERLSNAGQVCTSPKRIIVLKSVANDFIEKAKYLYEKVKIGDPQDKDTQLQPLVSIDAMEKVLDQVKETVEAGATLVYGGKRHGEEGAFMEPTILTDIKPGMLAYSDEIFGPVLSIYSVKDEEEAIKLANDTKFGLGATVICKDEERAVKVARQIDSGMVYINHVTTSVAEMPFGGVKNSGYGRELSHEGILEFTNHKLIRVSNPDAEY